MKPISCYLKGVNADIHDHPDYLYIYQRGNYREIIELNIPAGDTIYEYNLQLNPGSYAINAVALTTISLICTGVYGSGRINASDIIL
jgi:hypothetical protein